MSYTKQPLIALLLWVGRVLLTIRSYIWAYDQSVWFAEMIPIFLIVVGVVIVGRTFKFSSTAWICMAVLVYMHTIWAHYTFERVPFDRFTNLFGFERNHYDRVAHFSVWLYAYAIIEYFQHRKLTKKFRVSVLFGVFTIFTVASLYEIVEWIYAVQSDPEAWIAFLWSQWDIRDAQKDMLADGVWALFGAWLYYVQKRLWK